MSIHRHTITTSLVLPLCVWIMSPTGQDIEQARMFYDTKTGQTILIEKGQRWSGTYKTDIYLILKPHRGEVEWLMNMGEEKGDDD